MTSSSCHIIIYVIPCHYISHIIINSMSSLLLSFLWLSLSSLYHHVLGYYVVITEFTFPSCPWLFLLSSLGLFLDARKIFTSIFTLLVCAFYYALILVECALSLVSSSCFQCCFIYSLYNPTFSFIFVLYRTFK